MYIMTARILEKGSAEKRIKLYFQSYPVEESRKSSIVC
jgi:hypothetical protein